MGLTQLGPAGLSCSPWPGGHWWDGAGPAGSCHAGAASKPQRGSSALSPAATHSGVPHPALWTLRHREVPSLMSPTAVGRVWGTFPQHMQPHKHSDGLSPQASPHCALLGK